MYCNIVAKLHYYNVVCLLDYRHSWNIVTRSHYYNVVCILGCRHSWNLILRVTFNVILWGCPRPHVLCDTMYVRSSPNYVSVQTAGNIGEI